MENGGLLTREQIFAAVDTPVEELRVPEWGGTVKVKTLSAAEGVEFAELLGRPELAGNNMRAGLVVMAVVDENGRRIFSPEDVENLLRKGNRPFMRVYNLAAKLNGFSQAAIEEAEKNS